MNRWLKNGLSVVAEELLNDPAAATRKFMNLPYVNSLLHDHRTGAADRERQIFLLLSFELWYKRFFENSFD
jgi:asparagine synthase (glutamine-hydrolysing)